MRKTFAELIPGDKVYSNSFITRRTRINTIIKVLHNVDTGEILLFYAGKHDIYHFTITGSYADKECFFALFANVDKYVEYMRDRIQLISKQAEVWNMKKINEDIESINKIKKHVRDIIYSKADNLELLF